MYNECFLTHTHLNIPANQDSKLQPRPAKMSSTKPINRITLFKIPDPSNQERLLTIYKTLQQTAQKVFPPIFHLP
jgi:hypothetical protein